MSGTPSPVCDLCGGSGWITRPGSLTAHACGCQAKERIKQRIAAASIPKRYIHCTIKEFHDRNNASLMRAKKRIQEFVDVWPVADKGLLLMGGCGVGKTHLAVAALQEIILAGKPGHVRFSNFQDLVQEIQASFGSDQVPRKNEILQPLLDADLLVLDELGSQKPTPFVFDILYYIINSRYNDEKVTIFTTNYLDEPKNKGEEKLDDRIGDRLRSRLFEMTDRILFENCGDFRVSKGKMI